MKTICLLLISVASLAASTHAVAVEPKTNWKDPSISCKSDPSDPFASDSRNRDPHSKYFGECFDTSHVRAIQILNASTMTEYGFKPDAQKMYVANFRHRGQFWVAEIPLDGVRQVLMLADVQIKLLDLTFHHQVRFINNPDQPIKLYPQTQAQKDTYSGAPILVTDYMMSAIGLRPMSLAGTAFDKKEGMRGSYGQGIGFLSTEDTWIYDIGTNQKNDDDQYRLIVDPEQRKALLRFYLVRSADVKESMIYNTVSENCIVEAFYGFQFITKEENLNADDYSVQSMRKIEYPTTTVQELVKLGLIDSGRQSRSPSFRKEQRTHILPVPITP